MRALIRGLIAAALVALPFAAGSAHAAGGATVPLSVSPSPTVLLAANPHQPLQGDACGAAFAELGAVYAMYTTALLFCPLALCIPLIYQFGDLLVSAAVQVTYACAI